MALRFVTLASAVVASSGQSIAITTCNAADATQLWQLQQGPTTVASASGLCIATNSSSPAQGTDVLLQPCNGSGPQQWTYNEGSGFLQTSLAHGAPLCLTLAATTGPFVNLWSCSANQNNTQWDYVGGQLRTREGGAAGRGCLQRGLAPGVPIPVNGSMLGRRFDGIGGLAAIGGARLLYEYAEPYRSDILDLMFSPGVGAGYHVLKTEIEGDVDSSYGSGPSYQHTRDPASRSFNRGIYLPWLVQEAKKRNPALVLYSLAWGVPGWIGQYSNGTYAPNSYFSQDGLDYHVNYLVGAQQAWGTVYDYTGVWNERPFTRAFVKDLRAALDKAGLNHTKIVVNDRDDSSCLDCPPSWGDDSVHTALANDPDFRAAVGVVGFHSADVEGLAPFPGDWEQWGLSYWQTESNILDGVMPQWLPNDANPYGSGLSWPRVFLANYIRARATSTTLCPIMHSFTWNYGRENHGHSQLVEPWSGYYELGSGFWGQAHFGQLSAVGWRFIDGGGSNQLCTDANSESCYMLWGTLVSPDGSDVSLHVVNTQNASVPMSWQFMEGALARLAGASLAVWRTVDDDYFSQQQDVTVDSSGYLNVTIDARSVFTFTTLRTGSHTVRPIPSRAPFPLPLALDFDTQRLETPGRYLSDLYGAFHVQASPDGQGQALWQAVAADPGPNAWMPNGVPFTSLPAGTNFANGNISVRVFLTPADLNAHGAGSAYLCGRVPIWQPAYFAGSFGLGICLSVSGSQAGWTWQLQDNVLHGPSGKADSKVLASGAGTGAFVGAWHTLSLVFVDDSVAASLDGQTVATASTLRSSSGVSGIGTGLNTAYFDDYSLDATAGHGRTAGSYLFDLLPGESVLTNISGWAGLALDLHARSACTPRPDVPSQPLTITALGRFQSANNSGTHRMDIVRASDGSSMLPSGPITVTMGCTTDLLGFCYGSLPSAVTLPVGDTYYFVSEEAAGPGADGVREMTDPAKGTTHAHRDGTTYMSYAGPQYGCVAGRVLGTAAASGAASPTTSGLAWTIIPDLDTSFGPVNFVMA